MTEEAMGAPDRQREFADWVRPHLGAMARLAARLAPHADRDDVVQDALTRAWLKRGQYDPARGTPSVWLLAITADQARKAGRRARPLLAMPGDERAKSTLADARTKLRTLLEVAE